MVRFPKEKVRLRHHAANGSDSCPYVYAIFVLNGAMILNIGANMFSVTVQWLNLPEGEMILLELHLT